MAGSEKYAKRMSDHLGEPADAACPIMRPGGAAGQIGMATGGIVGAAIAGRGGKDAGDVAIGQNAWLGLTPTRAVVTKTSFMGKPTGEPLASITYAEVAEVVLTEGKITLRADLALHDGRHVAFEVKRMASGKQSVEVLELLRDRCVT